MTLRPPEPRLQFSTVLIAASASFFFCSKSVFVKCAYLHGADALTVLTLRMVFSLPFFLITGWLSLKRHPVKLAIRDWAALAGLGFLGYYLASVLDFAGLEHVSVGLERIILYSYPVLVVLGAAWFFGERLHRKTLLAAGVAWAGIAVAYGGELQFFQAAGRSVTTGSLLVLGSAMSYAAFLLLGGELMKRMKPALFTSGVISFSGVYVLGHGWLTVPWGTLTTQPLEVYGWSAVIAVFSTIIPGYLMGWGISRAGATRFAIIGTSGPVMTVVLAWLLLGEPVHAAQVLGLGLALVGGLAASLSRGKSARTGPAGPPGMATPALPDGNGGVEALPDGVCQDAGKD